MSDFNQRLATLDTSLFEAIPCQLYDDDRRSLLAIQQAIRGRAGTYCYLEIGSYMGGSLQPHLLDPKCKRIYSIDKRPLRPRDDRSLPLEYPGNSTAAMMQNLRRISREADLKIMAYESDAASVDRTSIAPRPELCFIDGEHTTEAVLSDFDFCRAVADSPAAIIFHDVNIIFPALERILHKLQEEHTPFEAYALPSFVFVIEFGGVGLHRHPAVENLLRQNWRAILPSLSSMEHYREVYDTIPVRVLRAFSRGIKRLRRRAS